MQPFSQRDPRWAGEILGGGPDTIEAAGCFEDVLTMIVYDAFDDMKYNPGTLNHILHYVQGDLLTDNALEDIWPDRFSHQSIGGFDAAAIAAAVASANSYAVLWISTAAVPSHFVIAWTPDGRSILDPWIGGVDALSGYGGPSAIHKTLIITKKPLVPAAAPPAQPPPTLPPVSVPRGIPIPMALYSFEIGLSPDFLPSGVFWIPPITQVTIEADAIQQAEDWSSSHGSSAIKVYRGDTLAPFTGELVLDLKAGVVPSTLQS